MRHVDNVIDKVLKEISIKPEDVENAIERHTSLRQDIGRFFNGKTELVGSYKRHTAVQPLKDVDILLWLPKQYVNIQSHTMFHPSLPKCSDSEARMEIFNAKKLLEKDYGLKINAIAYPNGDYSERDIELSKQSGYKCGITVDFGYNTIKTDIFRLKRLDVNDAGDINEFIVKSSGVWDFFKTRNGRKQDHGFSKNIEH